MIMHSVGPSVRVGPNCSPGSASCCQARRSRRPRSPGVRHGARRRRSTCGIIASRTPCRCWATTADGYSLDLRAQAKFTSRRSENRHGR